MKILVLLVGLTATAPVLGYRQAPEVGMKKRAPKVLSTSNAPVTESEARETFSMAERGLRQALHLTHVTPSVSIPAGSAPVRRDQVIAEMRRIYDVIRPKVKITPTPVAYDPSVLRMADPRARANLNWFVRMGAVARVGPLAVGPTNSLTVPQFGDAVGFFIARVAELTHLPSNKWSPELQPPPVIPLLKKG